MPLKESNSGLFTVTIHCDTVLSKCNPILKRRKYVDLSKQNVHLDRNAETWSYPSQVCPVVRYLLKVSSDVDGEILGHPP
jgi:hypothetical protein